MSEAVVVDSKKPGKAIYIAGWIITGLVGLVFLVSSIFKFLPPDPKTIEMLDKLGLTPAHTRPLGYLEIVCIIIYLVPQTAVFGAILLTGYMGGALCTHWRVGDDFTLHIIIGILVWLGIFLRDRRLWVLLPFRR